jgi:hypothetical protein
MTRPRGTTVEVLDYTKLAAACDEHAVNRPSYGTNGLLRKADGSAAVVISSEGVCSAKMPEPGMVYLDTEWCAEWQALPLEAVEACRTGETRDLADLIRTFGYRLDVNHLQWREWAGS